MITFHDTQGLASLSDAEMASFLVAEFEHYRNKSVSPDLETLISLGVTLADTGHQNLDQAAIDWLAAQPSPSRLGIVSMFLQGFWNPAFSGPPVTTSKVTSLLSAREGLDLDETTEYSYVLALCSVVESKAELPIKTRTSEILEEIRRRGFKDAHYDKTAKKIIGRLLGLP